MQHQCTSSSRRDPRPVMEGCELVDFTVKGHDYILLTIAWHQQTFLNPCICSHSLREHVKIKQLEQISSRLTIRCSTRVQITENGSDRRQLLATKSAQITNAHPIVDLIYPIRRYSLYGHNWDYILFCHMFFAIVIASSSSALSPLNPVGLEVTFGIVNCVRTGIINPDN